LSPEIKTLKNTDSIINIKSHSENCKFNQSCHLFSKASFTCTHKGGEYCGKYRALKKEEELEMVLA
jgi:hypothetical protein